MKGCRPLTESEADDVVASFWGRYAKRDKALFLLGTLSGFRISELLSLRLSDVIQGGQVVDRVTVERRHMKKKTEGRTILVHPKAKAALTDWIADLRRDGYMTDDAFVFQSRKGPNKAISRSHAWRVLKTVFADNELTGKLGTHSMRKTFANRVYDRLDRDLAKTQRALGHKNINSTISYLSFREEDIDAAILSI